MGCVLGEVRDFKKKVAGLEVSQTGRCSLLEGLRINSQSFGFITSDQTALEGIRLFSGSDEFNIIGIQ